MSKEGDWKSPEHFHIILRNCNWNEDTVRIKPHSLLKLSNSTKHCWMNTSMPFRSSFLHWLSCEMTIHQRILKKKKKARLAHVVLQCQLYKSKAKGLNLHYQFPGDSMKLLAVEGSDVPFFFCSFLFLAFFPTCFFFLSVSVSLSFLFLPSVHFILLFLSCLFLSFAFFLSLIFSFSTTA